MTIVISYKEIIKKYKSIEGNEVDLSNIEVFFFFFLNQVLFFQTINDLCLCPYCEFIGMMSPVKLSKSRIKTFFFAKIMEQHHDSYIYYWNKLLKKKIKIVGASLKVFVQEANRALSHKDSICSDPGQWEWWWEVLGTKFHFPPQ